MLCTQLNDFQHVITEKKHSCDIRMTESEKERNKLRKRKWLELIGKTSKTDRCFDGKITEKDENMKTRNNRIAVRAEGYQQCSENFNQTACSVGIPCYYFKYDLIN